MTLIEAIKQSPQHDQRTKESIPAHLHGLTAEQFTEDQFKVLRKALETNAKGIPYSTRIAYVVEINDCFDTFFGSRFGRVCRLEHVFEGNELDILLLKALQGGSDPNLYKKSQADRAEIFGMSTNAMQTRIQRLEDGKEILGHQVRISVGGRKQVAYDHTIHPVFLTLNLKEVYLLTIALNRAFSGSPFEALAGDVSNDIYAQLSDYAKGILSHLVQPSDKPLDNLQPDAPVAYRSEEIDAVFLLKSHQRCVLQMMDGATYHGHIDSRGNNLVLQTDDGDEVVIPDDCSAYSLRREE